MEEEAEVLLHYLVIYLRVTNAMRAYLMSVEHHELIQGLTVKLFQHAASLYVLSRGTRISKPSLEVHFWDVPSSYAIARVAVETYATFHYIFTSAKDADELAFRIYVYRIRGLKSRTRTPTTTPEGAAKIASAEKQIEELVKQLKTTQVYSNLNSDKKGDARKGEYGPSKTAMIRAALPNIGPGYAEALYGFLSEYAHSGYVSMFQTLGADTEAQQKQHLEGAISFCKTAVFAMINDLIIRYPGIEHIDPMLGVEIRGLSTP